MKKYSILLPFLFLGFILSVNVYDLNAQEKKDALNPDDCQLIVDEYLNTVTEFYGAATAFNDKDLYGAYPDFLDVVQQTVSESQKPQYAHLSNTIKTLYTQIQGVVEVYKDDASFTNLTKGGLQRLKSQVDSIAHKVKIWKKSCKQKWGCYLGTEGKRCNQSTAR